MIHRLIRRLRRDERGQALAEFALTLPMVLLLLAGIIEFGRGWNIKQVITDSAREGARMAALDNSSFTADSISARVRSRLAAVGIDTAAATITIAGDINGHGTNVTVSVSAPYAMNFVGALMHWTGSTPIDISSSATMRNE